MNTLIKTAVAATVGWLIYKVGDFKGSVCTSGLMLNDIDEEIREGLTKRGMPFRINAICAKVALMRNRIIENLNEEADDEAEEAD